MDAKGGDRYEYWREAESQAVLAIARAVPGPVAVLGSFHAERGDPSVDAYLNAGFADVFADAHGSARMQTETSGDRTDLILANDLLAPALDPDAGFVLAPAPAGASPEAPRHLPLVVALHPDRL